MHASGYVDSCLKKLESNLSAKAILVKEASGHCRVVAILAMTAQSDTTFEGKGVEHSYS